MDMIGPRTLEGGYSPSQVMSSAKRVVGVLGAEKVVWVLTTARGIGAKALAQAMVRERMAKDSLFIFMVD